MIVRRVGVLSVGKVFGCVYAVLGLIIGGLVSLLYLVGIRAGDHDTELAVLRLGVGSILFYPVLYGMLGFLGGVITAALYNFVASFAGGIEIELKRTDDIQKQ